MRKSFILSLIALTCCVTACKKKTKQTPPGADFREKYKGSFYITDKRGLIFERSPGLDDTDMTILHYQVAITYSITDSLLVNETSKIFMKPALLFSWQTGQKELVGIDETGKLYRNGGTVNYNLNGFVNTDSISHVQAKGVGNEVSIIDSLQGHRQ